MAAMGDGEIEDVNRIPVLFDFVLTRNIVLRNYDGPGQDGIIPFPHSFKDFLNRIHGGGYRFPITFTWTGADGSQESPELTWGG